MNKNRRLSVRCTEREFDIIHENALESNMNVSDYVKEMCMNKSVVDLDLSLFYEYNQKINEIQNEINRLVFSIVVLDQYDSLSMQRMINELKKIKSGQQEIIKKLNKISEKIIEGHKKNIS